MCRARKTPVKARKAREPVKHRPKKEKLWEKLEMRDALCYNTSGESCSFADFLSTAMSLRPMEARPSLCLRGNGERNRMKKKSRGRRVSTILLLLVLIIGMGLLIYPAFSEYWNSFHSSRAIISYAEKVANLNKEKYEQIWNAALEYNRRLSEKSNPWAMNDEDKTEYEAELNVDGTGNMGFISIPKANINLPLYHGTNEQVLQTSVGHIEGSSLPVGSIHSDEEDFSKIEYASHSVLSGHRGLPSARLFSDLDVMEVGDVFYLTILDQTLTYEVDEINIVVPSDTSKIQVVPGMDLVTLVTCTPYGINSHRLLVRGRRIENDRTRLNVRVTADAIRIEAIFVAPFIAAPVLLLLVFWVIIITSGRRRR